MYGGWWRRVVLCVSWVEELFNLATNVWIGDGVEVDGVGSES